MNTTDKKVLETVSGQLNVPDQWLYNLIRFESNFNPLARNKFTGARGLIQFMPSTASAMGFQGFSSIAKGSPTAADHLVSQYPDFSSQMQGPVLSYLKKYAPFPSEQSLYMTVFYPVARAWPINKEFPQNVQKVNPGIKTVYDYIKKVNSKFSVLPIAILLLIGISIYILQGESSIWHKQHKTRQILT